MESASLNRENRAAALAAMSDDEGLDILVVGGGVTGAGIALDATTRGLRTGIVEMQDWAAGTSSRSSKLVHGGLRYLYNLDFELVHEALRERSLLLSRTAPHLVKAQPFLWPLKTPVIERSYSAVGVGLYDVMARLGAKGQPVPIQRHFTRAGALEVFPDIKPDQLTGAIRFYDARVDDARLVISLVRTAVGYGAYAASRTQVVEFTRDDSDKVNGAVVLDLETGEKHTIKASRIINATGVWTEDSEAMVSRPDDASPGLKVLASKGIHIVVPKERINGEAGIFLRTEKSVLFIIPWERYWIIGTTDTDWHEPRQHPVATRADIDYVLEHANQVLSSDLTIDDVMGTYAGLRPLVQPAEKGRENAEGTKSTKVSREHSIAEVAPCLIAIAGGKLTTYRAMAQDAVDYTLGRRMAEELPSVTARTPLVGASGLEASRHRFAGPAGRLGWSEERIEHLLGRYGSEVEVLLDMVDEHPEWAEEIPSAPAYLRVEAAFAVLREGALHLEDILQHRIRLAMETRDRGVKALDDLTEIVAPLLDWDAETIAREQDSWRAVAAAEDAAEQHDDDASAVAVRLETPDLLPVQEADPQRQADKN